MKKIKRVVSVILIVTILITTVNGISIKAEKTGEKYPYTIFAASNTDGAITINAGDICVNGSITSNGTIISNGNMNINGTKTENADDKMIYIFDKIDAHYFLGESINTYYKDYIIEEMNININTPVEVMGKALLTGNININTAFKAFEDVVLNGEITSARNSVIFSKYGNISINSQNSCINGLVYAPFGNVEITAQNLNLNNALIIADTITINSSSVNINYNSSIAEYIGITSEIMNIPCEEWQYMKDENDNDFPDFLENVENWNKLKDTDGDGLPDCIEQYVEYNSDMTDSNGNGIDDFTEFLASNENFLEDSVLSLLREDFDNLEIGLGVGDSYDSINGDVVLPLKGENGSVVSWKCSDERIINNNGVVNRKVNEPTKVICTAQISLSGKSLIKKFSLVVMPESNIDSNNISDLSIDDLKQMNKNDSEFYVDVNEYGFIEQIYGEFSDITITSAETALYALYSVKTALGIKNPFSELELYDVDKDKSGMIFKYRQMVNGVPCFDNNIIISCDSDGKADYMLSDYFPAENNISTTPDISYDDIDAYLYEEYPNATICNVPEEERMCVFNYYGKTALVWKKALYLDDTKTYEILVNADNGDVVYRNELYSEATNDVFTIGKDLLGKSRSITVKEKTHWLKKTEYFLEDRTRNIVVYDADGEDKWSIWNAPDIIKNTKNDWTEEQVSAMANIKKVYDFYLDTFDRISYDDAWWKRTGNEIKIYLNTGMTNNASWDLNIKGILVGVGDSTGSFKSISLAAGADVLCHEFTHAVVSNETSLDKIYYGTTGAINEGYADLFACFLDNDWKVGEDVTIKDCLRDSENPNKTENPAAVGDSEYIDYKKKTEDYAGIHTNCTLVSHAAYLMYSKGMDMDTLRSLWYKSLCLGYSKHSDFYDVRLKVLKAAKKLKLSDAEKKIINKAFNEVNILKSNCDEKKTYFKNLDKHAISETFLDDELYMTGKVVEADTDNTAGNNKVLSDVIVSVNNIDDTECYSITGTDVSGIYDVNTESKESYRITFEKEGYLSENYYVNDIKSLQKELYCDTVELIPSSKDGMGGATGKIINAASGNPVDGLTLYVRKGINNIYSDIITTASTNEDGRYEITSLSAGNYTLEINDNRNVEEKNRYISSYMNIKIIGNTVIKEQNGVVSTALEKGQIRIVLTWGEYPRDLDSYLVSDSFDFCVYYGNKSYSKNGELICKLDLDDTTSYGPETTTLYNPLTGKYNFYVHNFSRESNLSDSEACVKVYIGGGTHPAYTFNVPNGNGRYWDVFTYNSATKSVIPVNNMR